MGIGFVALWAGGCAGWVGDSGVFECPDLPPTSIGFDEIVPGFDLSVQNLPMFAASPARGQLQYTSGGSTGLSLRIEPLGAMVRNARSPVLAPVSVRRCEEVVTSFRVAMFTDDGAFEWQTDGEIVVEDPDDTAVLSLSAPYAANLGAADAAESVRALLEAHPDLAPESVEPVVYRLAVDLTDRAPTGSLSLVLTHDPVPADDGAAFTTVTELVLGTY